MDSAFRTLTSPNLTAHRTISMKTVLRLLIVVISTSLSFTALAQSNADTTLPADLKDPRITGINNEPMHATLMPFQDRDAALQGSREGSAFYRSLNGQWKFFWVSKPADRPTDFYKPAFDVSAWKEIAVPGNWQFQGYDIPINVYTNSTMS